MDMDAFSGKWYVNKAHHREPPVPAETRRDYILVIDDDPAIVDLLVAFLHEDEGFRVHTSRSVTEVLHHTPQEPPGLILLDVSLPEEDGNDLAPSLRRLPGWHDAPIVLCSGRDSLQDMAEDVGAVAYLTKPFSLDDIAELAHQYMVKCPHRS